MNTSNLSPTKPIGFEDTRVAKLRRRIHLPTELYAEVHEERFIGVRDPMKKEGHAIKAWTDNYTHKTGWSTVFMESRYAILRAEKVEVILRRHPKLGNFILFRIWKDGNN